MERHKEKGNHKYMDKSNIDHIKVYKFWGLILKATANNNCIYADDTKWN